MALGLVGAAGALAADAAKPAAPAAAPADLNAEATYSLRSLIDAGSTLDTLKRRFGAGNVAVTAVDGAEGEQVQAVVLFAQDPERRVELTMHDEANQRGVDGARVRGAHSRWWLDPGRLRLGMTLSALVAANGKPVSFSGLDWDYGGMIQDWHGGALAPGKQDVVFAVIGLNHAENAKGYPTGEETHRSDEARFPKQGAVLFVGDMAVNVRGDD